LADWLAVMTRILGTPRGRITLWGTAPARLIARSCSAEAVTFGRSVLFSSRGWRSLENGSGAGLALLAHEAAHVAQYQRLGTATFLWAYVWEYLRGRLQGLSHQQAYSEISFEREARRVEREARRLLEAGALLRGTFD
jgi:hypothetical protein